MPSITQTELQGNHYHTTPDWNTLGPVFPDGLMDFENNYGQQATGTSRRHYEPLLYDFRYNEDAPL